MAKFSSRERELLAEICRNYPILTDTSYTLQTINQKKEAWVKIQAEFNSMNPGKPPRDGPQLKGLWKRLKLKAKSDIDAQKKDARQTGGGSPKPALGRPEQILSEMFSGQFDPLPDTMDDDAGPFQEGPEELEVSGCEAGTSQESEACETPKRPSKRKNTDNLQEELLKFAREEHEEKMKTQQAKRRLIAIQEESEKLRLLLLQHECTVLAAYISFGVEASHIITASIMSAPAALCYAKLFYPETEKSKTRVENMTLKKGDETGLLDAATKGAMAGTALVLGITANIIAFVAAVEFLNGIISWLAQLVGSHDIDFKKLLSLLFIPVVWLMGVHPKECENVAELVGLKTVVNEFVAYQRLGEMKKNGMLSERSEAIATYALCGFSNPGSIGILIAALSTMAPHRRSDITQVAVRAFIAGCTVCFLTACIAGLLITEENATDNLSLNATSTMIH